MFEDLNNHNQASRQSVDDIFAETDQAGNNSGRPGGSEITTRRVGLAASAAPSSSEPNFEEEKAPKSGNGFKIAVVGMVVVIVGLLGFLAYSKFFAPSATEQATLTPNNTQNVAGTKQPEAVNPNTTPVDNEIKEEPAFVTEIPMTSTSSAITTEPTMPAEDISSSTTIIAVDSDNDGLSDDEELNAKTNINLIDTDNDGLSDYEEIKIYKTNPLVADTDGDGYLDGQEVKNGFDPNVKGGKLPGNN